MHCTYPTVEAAFHGLVYRIQDKVLPTTQVESRNGPVLKVEEPLTVTINDPRKRVIFNPARNANPFFHVVEALWMLAGRRDVSPLLFYNRRMGDYSDNGVTLNGAYGFRWRHAELKRNSREFAIGREADQLDALVEHLTRNPKSRRAVLSMWNIEDDLMQVDDKTDRTCHQRMSKDVCCNLSVVFKIRSEAVPSSGFVSSAEEVRDVLDMTVFNRSNDIIWGMLGANAVHFTFLQEYMAARLGVAVGKWHQVSADAHVYLNNWKPEEWLKYPVEEYPEEGPTILTISAEDFDKCLELFFNIAGEIDIDPGGYPSEFLEDVARPMCNAWKYHKRRDYGGARMWTDSITACDWRIACEEWLYRTEQNYKSREKV